MTTSFFLDYDDWDMIWVLCKIYYGDNIQRHENDYCIKWVENTLTAFYSFLCKISSVIKPTSGFCLNLHHYLTFDESIEKIE